MALTREVATSRLLLRNVTDTAAWWLSGRDRAQLCRVLERVVRVPGRTGVGQGRL